MSKDSAAGIVFNRVLMVCTGNICRSPMAQLLLSRNLRRRGLPVVVESAGLYVQPGRPADAIAQELMRARGLDLGGHRARQITPELVRAFDLVLTMEADQQRLVEELDPSARGRAHRLGRIGKFDIPDPFGRGRKAFEESLALIERGLGELEKVFWSGP